MDSLKMSEGRRSQVVLLDERRLDIIIQSRLYAGELLDIVSSHFSLKEKEYFGIAFIDDTGQFSWLQLEKRVLEHDFPKKYLSQGATLVLYFRVKYFVESITQLRDSATIEAFYLQAKSLVAKGELDIDSDIVFQLAALVLQATFGDYSDDHTFKSHLKRLPILPSSTLKEYSSIAVCESKVLEYYKAVAGQTRGAAIVNYLSILESLPTYGQHYYAVKDKSSSPCWLGLSYRGISQYDKNDRRTPRRVFLWKQLENLYFRDRKFTVEVHEARRVIHTLSSFNLYEDAIEEPVEEFDDLSSAICDPTTQVSVSRRSLAPASVTVYVWYAASPNIAKCIWSMAIAQHQFFLDRNHKKGRNCVNRSLSQIASELCRSIQSLSSASSLSNISRSNSSTSLPALTVEGEISEEGKAAAAEMLTALQARKEALQDALRKKTAELKALCMKEGELTGELPPETPFQPGEAQPQVRRRIGTSFTLSDKIIGRAKSKDRETLNDLELDYEIQSKIASAAFKLANDATARKSVRKLRKLSYKQAANKLKDIEQKICTLKREKESQKKEKEGSEDGIKDDSRVNHLGFPISSSESSISEKNKLDTSLSNLSVPPSTSLPQLSDTCASAPPSPAKCRQRHQSLQHVPVIKTDVYEDINVNFEGNTRKNSSSYSVASEYDTVSCGSSSIASLGIPYRNRFEANLDIEGTNHYSVPNRRASQAFNDPDDPLNDMRCQEALNHFCIDDNLSNTYINPIPLSSSYDERLTYNTPREFGVIESASTGDCNFDKNSINSTDVGNYNYDCHVSSNSTRLENLNYSHSENSLHRKHNSSFHHELNQMHISEPDLNIDLHDSNRNQVAYNVPSLRNAYRPSNSCLYTNSPNTEFCTKASSHAINQVADLVQASVLLQDRKLGASSTSLEYCSPKSKTKEWIETSLDSPILNKKRKPKPSEHIRPSDHPLQTHWPENGLPSCGANDHYFTLQKQAKFHGDAPSISSCSISKLRKPPSPPESMYNSSVDFRNSDLNLLSPNSCNKTLGNSNYFVSSNDSLYHHYENAEEISEPKHLASCSTSIYENVQNSHDYNSNNFKVSLDMPDGSVQGTDSSYMHFDKKPPIAEPQQPPRHGSHRITSLADSYNSGNLPCIKISEYQTIQIDDYEPVNFRDGTGHVTYSQAHCDIQPTPLNSHNHEHLVYTENHSLPQDTASNMSSDNVSLDKLVQNWQPFSPDAEHCTSQTSAQNASFSSNVEVNVVSVGHFQPYWEETKPYELSDFYKYSTKHRKQHKNVDRTEVHSQSGAKLQDKVSEHSCDNSETSSSSFREFKYREENPSTCAQLSTSQVEPVVNHIPVFNNTEQLESPAKYYEGNAFNILDHSGSQDKSLSFSDIDIEMSLADTFHDEMVTWYQNRDSVKKATLV